MYAKTKAGCLPQSKDEHGSAQCAMVTLAIRDALDILSGKWKIAIIGTLSMSGKLRFMDLMRQVEGVAAKMLSKELRDLELNELVKRTVYDTKPVTVEYELTPYGKTLEKVIFEIAQWGIGHRKRMMRRG